VNWPLDESPLVQCTLPSVSPHTGIAYQLCDGQTLLPQTKNFITILSPESSTKKASKKKCVRYMGLVQQHLVIKHLYLNGIQLDL